MLTICTEMSDDGVKLVLEGSFGAPWVVEVDVDLSGVTFVSEEGKQLLEQIRVSGAEIVSSDLLTKALVDELLHKHPGPGKR